MPEARLARPPAASPPTTNERPEPSEALGAPDDHPSPGLEPSAGGARRFREALVKEGIRIRVTLPLVIETSDVDRARERFGRVLRRA